MQRPELSVIIPAWNEAGGIEDTLQRFSAHLREQGYPYEILVVDDGSTDGTRDIVREASATLDSSIRLIAHPENRGKGAALRTGAAASTGRVVVFTDADMPYTIANFEAMISHVRDGSADIAAGARDLPQSEGDPSYPLIRKLAGRILSILVKLFLRVPVFDTQCGLKAFDGELARSLLRRSRIEGFGLDFEIIYFAAREGRRIARVPVQLSHRHESRVNLLRDSVVMLRDLIAVRLRGLPDDK